MNHPSHSRVPTVPTRARVRLRGPREYMHAYTGRSCFASPYKVLSLEKSGNTGTGADFAAICGHQSRSHDRSRTPHVPTLQWERLGASVSVGISANLNNRLAACCPSRVRCPFRGARLFRREMIPKTDVLFVIAPSKYEASGGRVDDTGLSKQKGSPYG